MAKRPNWESRVAAWRASGLSSTDFCEGRDFTPGGLRHMAHRLRAKAPKVARRKTSPASIRLVRVLRAQRAADDDGAALVVAGTPRTPVGTSSGVEVVVGPARVLLATGFDRDALAVALEVVQAMKVAT